MNHFHMIYITQWSRETFVFFCRWVTSHHQYMHSIFENHHHPPKQQQTNKQTKTNKTAAQSPTSELFGSNSMQSFVDWVIRLYNSNTIWLFPMILYLFGLLFGFLGNVLASSNPSTSTTQVIGPLHCTVPSHRGLHTVLKTWKSPALLKQHCSPKPLKQPLW